MMELLEQVLRAWGVRVDREGLARVRAAVSVSTDETRLWLDTHGFGWVDERGGRFPGEDDLARSVEALTARERGAALVIGAAGAFGGWIGVAPELAATLVQTFRLAQRMAVVYGFEVESDRGQLVVTRALAAGWEIDVPDSSAQATRLGDVGALVRAQLATVSPRTVAGWAVKVTGKSVTARLVRFVPGLGMTLSATQSRRRLQEIAERMDAVLRRSCDTGSFAFEGERLAVEVSGNR